ncbi:MAG: hypothetical protein KDC35_21410 [Acidobacteria bacterium]|nr:hypothetical protein [Acidobacteriota bacterium]
MELDDTMKALLKDLGMALHQALTKDENVKAYTDKIKSNGYDIYLIMEANIALDKRDDQSEGSLFMHAPDGNDEIRLSFNQYDADFLASLKIKPDEL